MLVQEAFRQPDVKPRRVFLRLQLHRLLQLRNPYPFPICHFGRIGYRVSGEGSQQDHVVLMFDSSARGVNRAIYEFRSERQITGNAHLLFEPALARLDRCLASSWMAAASVRPNQGPEQLESAPSLNQQ